MKIFLSGLLCCFIFSSCAPMSSGMNRINIGMTKQEVVKVLGNPNNISAQNNAEYLNYIFTTDAYTFMVKEYFVRLVDGKVESYGATGDFDSTKPPEQKVIIDQTVKSETK